MKYLKTFEKYINLDDLYDQINSDPKKAMETIMREKVLNAKNDFSDYLYKRCAFYLSHEKDDTKFERFLKIAENNAKECLNTLNKYVKFDKPFELSKETKEIFKSLNDEVNKYYDASDSKSIQNEVIDEILDEFIEEINSGETKWIEYISREDKKIIISCLSDISKEYKRYNETLPLIKDLMSFWESEILNLSDEVVNFKGFNERAKNSFTDGNLRQMIELIRDVVIQANIKGFIKKPMKYYNILHKILLKGISVYESDDFFKTGIFRRICFSLSKNINRNGSNLWYDNGLKEILLNSVESLYKDEYNRRTLLSKDSVNIENYKNKTERNCKKIYNSLTGSIYSDFNNYINKYIQNNEVD